MSNQITYSGQLVIIECGVCAIPFAVPEGWHTNNKQTGKGFHCPNGCKIAYNNSENAKLRRQLEAAKARATHAQDQAQAAERSARAYKGQVTRIKKRVGNGVCPCCNRTFADLARHMESQHPGYADEGASDR